MSEQQAEPTSGETGSVSAGPAVSNSSDAASQRAAQESLKAESAIESPDLVPGQGDVPAEDASKPESEKAESEKAGSEEAGSGKAGAQTADAPRPDASRAQGKVLIMSSGDRNWDHKGVEPEAESEPNSGMFGKRRLSALAAVWCWQRLQARSAARWRPPASCILPPKAQRHRAIPFSKPRLPGSMPTSWP